MKVKIHQPADFVKMRKAGRLAAQTLDYITNYVEPGVSTNQLNTLCHEFIVKNNAIPAPLNYPGPICNFPKSICTSVNHVICHGIPNERPLKDGDIVNIDVTVIVDGWHGDTSRMYFVGDKVPIKARKLVDATYQTMMEGIQQVRPDGHVGDIGYAMETLAKKHKYSVVREYTGHGIGQVFHDDLAILNYGRRGGGVRLQEGMFFTVEPMVNIGAGSTLLSKHDGWTVTTRDKSLSAQFEHTIGVTKDGFEIFTLSPEGWHKPPYS